MSEARRGALLDLSLAAGIVGASISFSGVLSGWAWLAPLTAVVLLSLAGCYAARTLRAHPLLVALAGAAVWTITMCFVFFRRESLLGFIPGAETMKTLGLTLDAAWETVTTEVIPVGPDPALSMLLAGAMGLIAIASDAIVVSCRLPALGGTAFLSVLLVPAMLKPQSAGAFGFAAAAAAYLALLALGRPSSDVPRRSSVPEGARAPEAARTRHERAARFDWRSPALAAVVVGGSLVIPAAIPGFDRGLFPEGSRLNAVGQNVGLNPFISLGSDLRNPAAGAILHYATDSPTPLYLRTVTIDDFSGSRWGPTNRDAGLLDGLDVIGDGTARPDLMVTSTTTVDTGDFTSPYLPVPFAPSSVEGATGDLRWDPLSLSIKGGPGASKGQRYTVTSTMPRITEESLRAADAVPRNAGRGFEEIPGNVPELVREVTDDVAGGQSGLYEKALAIQSYLRDFTYSEQAPVEDGYDGTGMAVLETFLEQRSGYCVHFSAAMAVMARLEGIPSRIAVGFAPGKQTDATMLLHGATEYPVYEVEARDAHAWPELYFEGLGWVPFEPTPSRGVVPEYARTDASGSASTSQDEIDDLRPTAPASNRSASAPAAAPLPGDIAEVEETGDGQPHALWSVGATVGALLLLAVPALVRDARRRRRFRRGAVGAWEELEALGADYGLARLAAESPRDYAARLEAGLTERALGAKASDPGNDAVRLAPLLEAYERSAYGPPDVPASGRRGEGRNYTSLLADTAETARRGVPAWRRALIRAFPASLRQRPAARARHQLETPHNAMGGPSGLGR